MVLHMRRVAESCSISFFWTIRLFGSGNKKNQIDTTIFP